MLTADVGHFSRQPRVEWIRKIWFKRLFTTPCLQPFARITQITQQAGMFLWCKDICRATWYSTRSKWASLCATAQWASNHAHAAESVHGAFQLSLARNVGMTYDSFSIAPKLKCWKIYKVLVSWSPFNDSILFTLESPDFLTLKQTSLVSTWFQTTNSRPLGV